MNNSYKSELNIGDNNKIRNNKQRNNKQRDKTKVKTQLINSTKINYNISKNYNL